MFSNIFLVAFAGSVSGVSLFFSVLTVSVLSLSSCWFFLFDGFSYSGDKEFKVSIGFLTFIVLLNGFFSWSQGALNLNGMLITASQTLIPYLIVFSGKRVSDNLLFDFAAMILLFIIPTYFGSTGVWVLKDGTPISSLPLLVSAMSAVVVFKSKLGDLFHLPLGLSKQELMGALFVVAATIASLIFVKAFFGESASVEGLNWQKVLPFGWFTYVIPALFSEIIYRAVFMNWVTKITGSFSMGLVTSAILFGYFETGFIYSSNKIALASGILLGVFNGIAYQRVGSLTVPLLANIGFISTLVLIGL